MGGRGGVVRILAGQPYFKAESGPQLEHTIRNYHQLRPLPLSWLETLRAVVARALSPDPRIRFSTAEEFAHALESIRTGSARSVDDTIRTEAAVDAEATRRVSQESNATVRTHGGSALPRTTATAEPKATRRTSAAPPPITATHNAGSRPVPAFPMPRRRSSVGKVLQIFWWLFFAVPRAWIPNRERVPGVAKADQLASDLSSDKQQDLDAAWRQYAQLTTRSHVGFSLWSAKDAPRNRLMNDVDHTIAKYDESAQSVVLESDWARARGEVAHALQLAPNNKTIHGSSA